MGVKLLGRYLLDEWRLLAKTDIAVPTEERPELGRELPDAKEGCAPRIAHGRRDSAKQRRHFRTGKEAKRSHQYCGIAKQRGPPSSQSHSAPFLATSALSLI